ncbi:hypothetical protein PROFUN_16695 [Planoprotostelium fungivorum]|uniref:Uncharacterized protein n=1 Tax=Planoprotostelium fungivorum TaxID=1890364 RepID=A0A2P6MPT2_9EUKA|nr:hypothetical protein PROFUN_16695 [Planoprotostelium fungivorum]
MKTTEEERDKDDLLGRIWVHKSLQTEHRRTKQFNESLFIKNDFKPKKAKVFLFNECAYVSWLLNISSKENRAKIIDELPVSKLLNYLTRDNIIELIGFSNFSNLNEQVRQQTGKVSLPAVKKIPKKQFSVCVAKHTPPEENFASCREYRR